VELFNQPNVLKGPKFLSFSLYLTLHLATIQMAFSKVHPHSSHCSATPRLGNIVNVIYLNAFKAV